jgi:hypothetical protein
VALAQLDDKALLPGAGLFVPLPSDIDVPRGRHADVHVADLPFLPNPDPIDA